MSRTGPQCTEWRQSRLLAARPGPPGCATGGIERHSAGLAWVNGAIVCKEVISMLSSSVTVVEAPF